MHDAIRRSSNPDLRHLGAYLPTALTNPLTYPPYSPYIVEGQSTSGAERLSLLKRAAHSLLGQELTSVEYLVSK